MPEQRSSQDRAGLLADVAEMYYWEDKNQNEIARIIGVTRSMVSRLLTEARLKGIVEVRIHRPLLFDHLLESELTGRFGLLSANVLEHHSREENHLLKYLGRAGADLLKNYLAPNTILGLAWGTSVSAVVDEIDVNHPLSLKIVQLVGALGAQNNQYDGHGLVQRLVEKIGGEGYYLNAPFICTSPEIAASLQNTPGIRETVALRKKANLVLAGVGSTDPQYSSFFLAGYVPLAELNQLIKAGAVGDVCGLHFDISGKEICDEFCKRLVTISRKDLQSIPVRIGVAGGSGKTGPILGALRGGYINALVTDSNTARRLLDLDLETKFAGA
jgi:DNA-binding transcriptional regulator LsrR (DeoR family)